MLNLTKTELTKTELERLLTIIDQNPNDDIIEIARKVREEIEFLEEFQNIVDECPYELSENQKQFVLDCLALDLEVDWDYSGRGMMGRQCPSVRIDDSFLKTSADVTRDSMGMGYIHYARY